MNVECDIGVESWVEGKEYLQSQTRGFGSPLTKMFDKYTKGKV